MKESELIFFGNLYTNLEGYINNINTTRKNVKDDISLILKKYHLDGDLSDKIKDEIEKIINDKNESFDFTLSFLLKHINNLNIWFANAMSTFDQSTGKHIINVGNMVLEEVDYLFGLKDKEKYFDDEIINLDRNLLNYIYMLAAFYHDIGKLGVSRNVLNLPFKLEGENRKEMDRHTVYGKKILDIQKKLRRLEKKLKLKFSENVYIMTKFVDGGNEINELILKYVIKGAYKHHEKLDGNGYPKGNIDNISKIIRLISIVDIFEGASSQRIYNKKEELKDFFISGIESLFYHRKGLDRHFLASFLKKFGIEDFYDFNEDYFKNNVIKNINFNDSNVVKELKRIERSSIKSKKIRNRSIEAKIIHILTKINDDKNDKKVTKDKSIKNKKKSKLLNNSEIFNLIEQMGLNYSTIIKLSNYITYTPESMSLIDLVLELLNEYLKDLK